jgi:hypothetical protein
MKPIKTIIIDITVENIGLSIKKSLFIFCLNRIYNFHLHSVG